MTQSVNSESVILRRMLKVAWGHVRGECKIYKDMFVAVLRNLDPETIERIYVECNNFADPELMRCFIGYYSPEQQHAAA